MSKQGKAKNYIFTSKKQSEHGIMSTVLGVISLTSFVIVILMSLKESGDASLRMGAVGLVSLLMSIASLVLACMSLKEEGTFPLFPRMGMVLAVLSLVAWGFIIYIGVVGL